MHNIHGGPKVRTQYIVNYCIPTVYLILAHHVQYIDRIAIIKYLKVLQHVSDHIGSIIREPCVQCLAKNYNNHSIVSVDMDKVGVMAAYCDRCARVCVRVCSSLYRRALISLFPIANRINLLAPELFF